MRLLRFQLDACMNKFGNMLEAGSKTMPTLLYELYPIKLKMGISIVTWIWMIEDYGMCIAGSLIPSLILALIPSLIPA